MNILKHRYLCISIFRYKIVWREKFYSQVPLSDVLNFIGRLKSAQITPFLMAL